MTDSGYSHRSNESDSFHLSVWLRLILSALKTTLILTIIVFLIIPVWFVLGFLEDVYMRLRGYRFNEGWGYYEKTETLKIIEDAKKRIES